MQRNRRLQRTVKMHVRCKFSCRYSSYTCRWQQASCNRQRVLHQAVSETGQNSWSVTLTYTDTASQVSLSRPLPRTRRLAATRSAAAAAAPRRSALLSCQHVRRRSCVLLEQVCALLHGS